MIRTFAVCVLIVSSQAEEREEREKLEVFPYVCLVKNVPGDYAEYLRKLNLKADPGNGVDLRLEGMLQDEKLRLRWTLHYSGKRLPFITLRPSLLATSTDQTRMVLICGNSKEVVQIRTCANYDLYDSLKGDFLRAEKGEASSGEFVIPRKELFDLIRKYMFFKDQPSSISIQLIHSPFDRGLRHKLDAWTGVVKSNRVEFRLNH